MGRSEELAKLREEIIHCTTCPRLVEYRELVSKDKRKAYEDWDYWGRPVPGFGDSSAELVIVGLAPAAHGGNRTGRVFTGDPSASFLMENLHEAGFASQPTSERRDDGLKLVRAYMTAAVRCAPPGNRPTSAEVQNCASYLERELDLLRPKAILALGRLAFDASARYLERRHGIPRRELHFRHGVSRSFGRKVPTLFASYHPSPRNTNTGLLTRESFLEVLRKVRAHLGEQTPEEA